MIDLLLKKNIYDYFLFCLGINYVIFYSSQFKNQNTTVIFKINNSRILIQQI